MIKSNGQTKTSKRAESAREPRRPPDWLSPEAKVVWERTEPRADKDADADALVVYCCAVADFNKAQNLLDRTGPVIQSAEGRPVRSPLQPIKQAAAAQIRILARDLGLVEAPTRPGKEAKSPGFRNQAGAERTIAALRDLNHLQPVDDATLALVRTIATALDSVDPSTQPAPVASLARVQLAALKMLRGLVDDNDSLGDLLKALSSQVGDAPES